MARRDNSIMDIAYGPTFAIATFGTVLATDAIGTYPLIVASLISLWATRLGLRILKKNWGKAEDARYAAWRAAWMERGLVYFISRSYAQVFLLQGIIISIVALPAVIALSFPLPTVSIISLIGIAIFFAGLITETTADWQLDAFIARKKAGTEPATFMNKGLFRFSRRPNYFGESLIWWGLAITVLTLPFGFVALLSPLLITYIVTKITGPMLEKIFIEKYGAEYQAYMKLTSYFIPLPPKRS